MLKLCNRAGKSVSTRLHRWLAQILLFSIILCSVAKADPQEQRAPLRDFFHGGSLVTEFGFAYKLPSTTSVVLLPECHSVLIKEHNFPLDEAPGSDVRSCGGDDPVFIGWPIAWEKDFSGPWSIRAGWFHLSHWFDGGPNREVHMDAPALVFKFNWSERRRIKRQERRYEELAKLDAMRTDDTP